MGGRWRDGTRLGEEQIGVLARSRFKVEIWAAALPGNSSGGCLIGGEDGVRQEPKCRRCRKWNINGVAEGQWKSNNDSEQ